MINQVFTVIIFFVVMLFFSLSVYTENRDRHGGPRYEEITVHKLYSINYDKRWDVGDDRYTEPTYYFITQNLDKEVKFHDTFEKLICQKYQIKCISDPNKSTFTLAFPIYSKIDFTKFEQNAMTDDTTDEKSIDYFQGLIKSNKRYCIKLATKYLNIIKDYALSKAIDKNNSTKNDLTDYVLNFEHRYTNKIIKKSKFSKMEIIALNWIIQNSNQVDFQCTFLSSDNIEIQIEEDNVIKITFIFIKDTLLYKQTARENYDIIANLIQKCDATFTENTLPNKLEYLERLGDLYNNDKSIKTPKNYFSNYIKNYVSNIVKIDFIYTNNKDNNGYKHFYNCLNKDINKLLSNKFDKLSDLNDYDINLLDENANNLDGDNLYTGDIELALNNGINNAKKYFFFCKGLHYINIVDRIMLKAVITQNAYLHVNDTLKKKGHGSIKDDIIDTIKENEKALLKNISDIQRKVQMAKIKLDGMLPTRNNDKDDIEGDLKTALQKFNSKLIGYNKFIITELKNNSEMFEFYDKLNPIWDKLLENNTEVNTIKNQKNAFQQIFNKVDNLYKKYNSDAMNKPKQNAEINKIKTARDLQRSMSDGQVIAQGSHEKKSLPVIYKTKITHYLITINILNDRLLNLIMNNIKKINESTSFINELKKYF
ncbi:hypothetical protein COBT_001062 [Conglomerata obtusa]